MAQAISVLNWTLDEVLNTPFISLLIIFYVMSERVAEFETVDLHDTTVLDRLQAMEPELDEFKVDLDG